MIDDYELRNCFLNRKSKIYFFPANLTKELTMYVHDHKIWNFCTREKNGVRVVGPVVGRASGQVIINITCFGRVSSLFFYNFRFFKKKQHTTNQKKENILFIFIKLYNKLIKKKSLT